MDASVVFPFGWPGIHSSSSFQRVTTLEFDDNEGADYSTRAEVVPFHFLNEVVGFAIADLVN